MARHSESHGITPNQDARATPAAGGGEDVASNWVGGRFCLENEGETATHLCHQEISKMRMKTVKDLCERIHSLSKDIEELCLDLTSWGAASVGVC